MVEQFTKENFKIESTEDALAFDRKIVQNNKRLMDLAEEFFTKADDCESNRFAVIDEMINEIAMLHKDGYNDRAIELIIPFLPILPYDVANQTGLWGSILNFPSISLDQAVIRNHKRNLDTKLLSESSATALDAFSDLMKSRYTKKKQLQKLPEFKEYRAKLELILRILREKYGLPEYAYEFLAPADPKVISSTMEIRRHISGITDFTLSSWIRNIPISDNTWLSAIELALSTAGFDSDTIASLDALSKEDLDTLIKNRYHAILVNGVMIHTISTFAQNEIYQKLYETTYERDKEASEKKALRTENQNLRGQIGAANKKIEEQKARIKFLEKNKSSHQQKSDKEKQTATLIHQHNNETREKDRQIEQMRQRIEQLENERMEAEHRAMLNDEKIIEDKPWLELELPKKNVVFLGGHQNMYKKLQDKYRGWTFMTLESGMIGLPKNPEAIFVWSGHLSHTLWQKLNEAYGGREKITYVSATNISRLEEEMKHGLWKLQTQNS